MSNMKLDRARGTFEGLKWGILETTLDEKSPEKDNG
jgi:hypothetical protein